MPHFSPGDKKGKNGDSPKPPTRPDIPLYIEPRCHVCQSPHRRQIDKIIAVGGISYSEISRLFEGIDRRSISRHAKEHLNYEEAAIRKLIEDEAQAVEADLEEGVKGVLARRTYLQVGLRKALESLMNDEITVEPKDAIAMIQVLDKLDVQTEGAQIDELRTQFNAFVTAIREIVPRDMHVLILARVKELLDKTPIELNSGE